jgi:hypothetical protein
LVGCIAGNGVAACASYGDPPGVALLAGVDAPRFEEGARGGLADGHPERLGRQQRRPPGGRLWFGGNVHGAFKEVGL